MDLFPPPVDVTSRGVRPLSPRLAALLVAGAIVAAAPDAGAQNTRFTRFFFRAALGVGYGFATTSITARNAATGRTTTTETTIRGAGSVAAFAIGVNVVRNLALHVDAAALALVNPSLRVNDLERTGTGANTTTAVSLVGAGVTWRIPSVLWASVTGGATVLSVELPDARNASHGLTDFGWGLSALVGRDFDLIDSWHVGVALHGLFAQMPDRAVGAGDPPTWTLGGVGLTVSVVEQ